MGDRCGCSVQLEDIHKCNSNCKNELTSTTNVMAVGSSLSIGLAWFLFCKAGPEIWEAGVSLDLFAVGRGSVDVRFILSFSILLFYQEGTFNVAIRSAFQSPSQSRSSGNLRPISVLYWAATLASTFPHVFGAFPILPRPNQISRLNFWIAVALKPLIIFPFSSSTNHSVTFSPWDAQAFPGAPIMATWECSAVVHSCLYQYFMGG